MCDSEELSEDQWQRRFSALRQRCNCLEETVQHQSGKLIVNGNRQNGNAKAITIITGVTNKVRSYRRLRRNCFTDLLLMPGCDANSPGWI